MTHRLRTPVLVHQCEPGPAGDVQLPKCLSQFPTRSPPHTCPQQSEESARGSLFSSDILLSSSDLVALSPLLPCTLH